MHLKNREETREMEEGKEGAREGEGRREGGRKGGGGEEGWREGGREGRKEGREGVGMEEDSLAVLLIFVTDLHDLQDVVVGTEVQGPNVHLNVVHQKVLC